VYIKRKHRAARRYAMFSGGEKIVLFLLSNIGYTTGATLIESEQFFQFIGASLFQ
jgi:hypothetical protein